MRLPVLTVAALVLASCAAPPEGAVGDDGDFDVTGALASSLEVGITQGEVRLTFHVTNTTSAPLEFTFPTSQRYDFVVSDEQGNAVWRWSDDRAFLQAVTHATLEPGETWTMESAWHPDGASGGLVATGRLTSTDRPVERRALFELP